MWMTISKASAQRPCRKLLDENNVSVVLIPPNCTDRLQPLDVSVNKSAKEFLCKQFHTWYLCPTGKEAAKTTS